jgi:hypothetical protein
VVILDPEEEGEELEDDEQFTTEPRRRDAPAPHGRGLRAGPAAVRIPEMKLLYPFAALLALYLVAFLVRAWWRTPKSGLASLRCFFRGHHLPTRHALGGFTCSECGHAGADLSAMGYPEGGYIPSVRRVYDRDRTGGFTRTTAWGPGPKGW